MPLSNHIDQNSSQFFVCVGLKAIKSYNRIPSYV